jgi:hypothetical protein
MILGTQKVDGPLRMYEIRQRPRLWMRVLDADELAVMRQVVVELVKAAVLEQWQ